jgi:hypothetical protein
MTPLETAVAMSGPIHDLGGVFMRARPTLKRGPELGFPRGWSFYICGRGGVLGDVVPDVIAAAYVFFPVAFVQQQWLLGRAVMEPAKAAEAYAEACRDWGREHLAGVDADLDRLVELLRRVAAAADPAGAPLFAGWRALPLPDDAEGATAQLLQVLREHRGAMHGIAVLATGLTPLEAVMADNGEEGAQFFNWPEPYPEREPLLELYGEAEELTDEMCAEPFEALSADEREELVTLAHAASGHVFNVTI